MCVQGEEKKLDMPSKTNIHIGGWKRRGENDHLERNRL